MDTPTPRPETSVPCTWCGVKKGERCRQASGLPYESSHSDRRRLFARTKRDERVEVMLFDANAALRALGFELLATHPYTVSLPGHTEPDRHVTFQVRVKR